MDDIESILKNDPELRQAIEEVLRVDSQRDTWTFHDVDIDSGAFGEIVSHGIVKQDGDGYTVTDADSVRAMLEGQPDTDSHHSESNRVSLSDLVVDSYSRVLVIGLCIALLLVAAVRAYFLPDLIHRGEILFLGNDPYIARASLERIAAAVEGPFDLSLFLEAKESPWGPSFAFFLVWTSEVLTLGGELSDLFIAFYPLLSALVTGLLVYGFASRVTNDRRVGLASILMLAVAPSHVLRTAVGFSDHSAFDYPLLIATGYLLTILGKADWERTRDFSYWIATILFGVVVAVQLLAWKGAPLYLVPPAAFIALMPLLSIRTDSPVLPPLVLIGIGFGIASTVTGITHLAFGWQELYSVLLSSLFFIATLVAATIMELLYRWDFSVRSIASLEIAGVALSAVFLPTLPVFNSLISEGIAYFTARTDSQVAETLSMIESGIVSGPIITFGTQLVFGVLALLWASWRVYDQNDFNLLAPVIYTWYFLGLSLFIQRRFTGELAPFMAIFTGIAFVFVAQWTDVIAGPELFSSTGAYKNLFIPDTRTLLYLFVLFIFFGSLGAAMVPGWINNVQHDESLHDASVWMSNHSNTHDLEYPENYVFGDSGHNPMLNYHVNQRPTYWYARYKFPQFLASTDPESWYYDLRNRSYYRTEFRGPIGYIVIQSKDSGGGPKSIYTRLYHHFGSQYKNTSSVSHYRLRYIHPETDTKVFTLVEGADLVGTAAPNSTVSLSTSVEVSNHTFTYRKRVKTGESGRFNATVPYPGQYQINGWNTSVSAASVSNGTTVGISGTQ